MLELKGSLLLASSSFSVRKGLVESTQGCDTRDGSVRLWGPLFGSQNNHVHFSILE